MSLDIRLGHVSDQKDLGDYYLDFSNTIDPVRSGLYGPIDGSGVPLVDYDKLFGSVRAAAEKGNYGVHYTPVTVAQYGLALYGSHLREANGERRYLEAAQFAFRAFDRDLREGGGARRDEAGDLWLEEYPTDPPCHVLNGFIFALWGVLDLYRATGDGAAGEMYRGCVDTLRKNIGQYEGMYWSKYHVFTKDNVSPDYHLIHVMQLQVIAELNSDTVLADTAKRWAGYAGGEHKLVRSAFRVARGVMRRLGVCGKKQLRGVSFYAATKGNR